MLITSRFAFVHIPRTGGSFVRKLVRKHLAAEVLPTQYPTHASYDELDGRLAQLPAFCVVRNPWDWYVSWFHWIVSRAESLEDEQRGPDADPAEKAGIWRSAFQSGRSDFREAVTRACTGRLSHSYAASMRRDDVDLYTKSVRELAGRGLDSGSVEAGRFESVRDFLEGFLERLGALTEVMRDSIRIEPPVRQSTHGAYREYYDAGLRALVAQKAAWLIDCFGYTF